jgi:flavorubredoxin
MAENILKTMSFKMPVESLKKKFSPSKETLDECFEFGVKFGDLLK